MLLSQLFYGTDTFLLWLPFDGFLFYILIVWFTDSSLLNALPSAEMEAESWLSAIQEVVFGTSGASTRGKTSRKTRSACTNIEFPTCSRQASCFLLGKNDTSHCKRLSVRYSKGRVALIILMAHLRSCRWRTSCRANIKCILEKRFGWY